MCFDSVKHNLEQLGYAVRIFPNKESAVSYLNQQIHETTVAIGGSVTVAEMGLYDQLAAHNQVFWHWRTPEGQTADQIRAQARDAQIYLCSVNALAESGQIVHVDGIANRTSSIHFGHKKVYFLVGENKLVSDLPQAVDRARNIAAPKNAQRLGVKTPCAQKADRCYDCSSPERICRALSVLWCKPQGQQYEVVLIQESLGY